MDFLDPKKRRAHRIRLMATYVIVGVLIAVGTIVLVYRSYGYGVDTSTGQVVENGLVFIDSRPKGTLITLNGEQKGNVDARLVLRAGNYSISITKDGYRQWKKDFTLEGHSIERLVYPFLFPESINPKVLDTYPSSPGLVSQSPDRKWLIVQKPASLALDVIDTSNIKNAKQVLTPPEGLFTSKPGGVLKEVEWSTNNRSFILLHSFEGGSEYVLMDREAPQNSFNINKRYGVTPSQVFLRDKKPDQLYILNSDKSVRVADTSSGVLSPPLLQNVLSLKPYQANLVIYVTAESDAPGFVQARIWDDGVTYRLSQLQASDKYLLDAASFDGHLYFVIGSSSASGVDIYKDALGKLKQAQSNQLAPFLKLKINDPQAVSFSANARFVAATSGQNVALFDFESERSQKFTLDLPVEDELRWMDGHRFITKSGTNVLVVDYDGWNKQLLTTTLLNRGGYFDRDFNRMFVTAPNDNGTTSLRYIELRTGNDLPEQDR